MTATTCSPDTVEIPTAEVVAPLRVVACAARTARGAQRSTNEDAMLVASPLLAVADGVGGRRAGEQASAVTLDVLRREVRALEDHLERELTDALQAANEAVRAAASAPWTEGMATTIVAALVGPGTVTVAHVGDSRAYLIRGGTLRQLTIDHTLVSTLIGDGELDADAARRHPLRSVILRAVGLEAAVRPDVTTVAAGTDDVLLLCSDGLSDAVDAAHLERLVRAEPNLDHLVERLVDAALEAGSGDDVTVVAARLG